MNVILGVPAGRGTSTCVGPGRLLVAGCPGLWGPLPREEPSGSPRNPARSSRPLGARCESALGAWPSSCESIPSQVVNRGGVSSLRPFFSASGKLGGDLGNRPRVKHPLAKIASSRPSWHNQSESEVLYGGKRKKGRRFLETVSLGHTLSRS